MSYHRSTQAMSIWLTVLRNPGIDTQDICEAMGIGDRTFQRRVNALRACGVNMFEEKRRDGQTQLPSRWTTSAVLTQGYTPPDGDEILWRWLRHAGGSVDLTKCDPDEKIQWYREIIKLMLVGTPPWSPSDHVDVTVHQGTLYIVLPQGRSVNHPDVLVHRDPSHA